MIAPGQVWTPARWAGTGSPREVLAVADGFVEFRCTRQGGRVHRLNVADFAAWAAYWEATHG